MQKNLSYLLAMLLFTMLFIPGMSFSGVAQTSHPAPHAVKQSKPAVKPAGNKKIKALNEEEPVKDAREREDPELPNVGGSDNASLTPSNTPERSSTELWLLLAALVILPGLPFIFISKKYPDNGGNRMKRFRGWLSENQNAIQWAYIIGIVVILFIYAQFFENYGSTNATTKSYNDSIQKHNDSIQKRNDFIKDLNEKMKTVPTKFKKSPKQQKPGVDSTNN